ncbi:L-lactate permease [Acidisarcina polymorpha]|uniref:L-lactate permease n=1 Tax=Acidisarcina polymorpha TaxID=2211140 RepID=A0A2Z5G5T7_9BACT|nr:lactate permease LctP family transporter [Acidisarcina polymorpha]AXC14572.1 L-lactate permease [Acidisarcina polymorpha]
MNSSWQQTYTLLGQGLPLSAAIASVPIVTLLFLLGVKRKPAWLAALCALGITVVLAAAGYKMPPRLILSAAAYGAAFGLFPISWIVLWAIVLYQVTVASGRFEVIHSSLGSLTTDLRLQALLVAFAFGAFVEGATGFGTPVAVASAMLVGFGFNPFYAAAVCLLANTVPVAFGSIGIPVVTLAGITGLPLGPLSAAVGRLCAPLSMILPGYLIVTMVGWRRMQEVWPAVALAGGVFGVVQFLMSNYVSPQLTDIVSSLSAILALLVLLRFWRPRHLLEAGDPSAAAFVELRGSASYADRRKYRTGEVLSAWMPYALLVLFVLLWGFKPVQGLLNSVTINLPWPWLHNVVQRMPPVVAVPLHYAALYQVNWLSAAGTACMFAALVSVLLVRLSLRVFLRILRDVIRQLFLPTVTVACVLSLAFVMNYCGATATLGLAFAGSGALFPFFSPLLGWLGVFLTGSDTSANALFGNLQVMTASRLGFDPLLMAAANSAGGVMGKMISLQTIAVAAAATGMSVPDQARLFRFTLRHSILLTTMVGLEVLLYAYAFTRH